jgi:predicted metal-dependent phosphoesterase TrpH
MIKTELHAHTSDDPADRIPHDTDALLRRASAAGYGALAITLHNRWFDPAPWQGRASALGLVLLSGVERTIAGKHLLLINFPRESETVPDFFALRQLKVSAPAGLVVAPHPFFPIPSALGPLMDSVVDLVDAVELSAMYVRGFDYNRPAVAWAATHRKPLVGNCDLHRLDQLGTTWSSVESAPDPDAICAAIKAGAVTVETRRLGWLRAAWTFARMEIGGWGGGHLR